MSRKSRIQRYAPSGTDYLNERVLGNENSNEGTDEEDLEHYRRPMMLPTNGSDDEEDFVIGNDNVPLIRDNRGEFNFE